MAIHIIWTDEKKESVINSIEQFLKERQWTSGESVIQSDAAYIALPEWFAELIDETINPERRRRLRVANLN